MKLFAATLRGMFLQTAASDQTEAPERFENGLVAGPLRQHGANAWDRADLMYPGL
jgi:hypothetical protein